ncbi:MAG: glucohydrolase, partial [Spirochaetales bacterium]
MAHTPWWQKTTLYQIYPRSFSDSNNDGIGDIQGIISRLDYVRQMGFETIWLSPHYVSPQKDFGYDIADYLNVAGEYGTLQDVQKLIDEVHARGMKIIFDMILNHTSDEHPWFRESCSSRTNPRR